MEIGDFFNRLFFLVVFGCLLILAFARMARKYVSEHSGQNFTKLQIMGCFIALLGVLAGVYGIFNISQVRFPEYTLAPTVYINPIVRSPYIHQFGEMPTQIQLQSVNYIANAFILFAISTYCVFFRSSGSNWWKKIFKLVFCIVLLIVYKPATDFHYFDAYEWSVAFFYVLLLFFAFWERSKKGKVKVAVAISEDVSKETVSEPIRRNEDESRFMPKGMMMASDSQKGVQSVTLDNPQETDSHIITNSGVNINDEVVKQSNASDEEKDENIDETDNITTKKTETPVDASERGRRFCRFCGNMVNYETDIFCKHCGNKL